MLGLSDKELKKIICKLYDVYDAINVYKESDSGCLDHGDYCLGAEDDEDCGEDNCDCGLSDLLKKLKAVEDYELKHELDDFKAALREKRLAS